MLAGPIRLPRRTVRLRLTLLYGALFLASGVGLLVLTNVLVRQATGEVFFAIQRSNDAAEPGNDARAVASFNAQPTGDLPAGTDPMVVRRLLDSQLQEFRAAALAQRAADRRLLIIQSGVALGVMAFVSMGLGWWVAGRVLRPLRTITAAARDISATNLHERLALSGPDDELKELGDTFDELLGRLEGAFEAQRRFVANASHELRTPLARQRTLIEVALTDPDATVDSLRSTYQRVLASGEQQERLIEALLTLARSERGLEKLEPVDLAVLVDDVLHAAQAEIQGLALQVRSRLEPARVLGDSSLLDRMVANLVDNALRYNQADGGVDISTGADEGYVFLRVSNTGPSIPPEGVDVLFQPFRRLGADRLRHGDGHGLGLSIVQSVAAAHGATLHTSARREGGLVVEVKFPSRA